MVMTINHIVYLMLSILITVLVGHTLHKHGRPFLMVVFQGNERIADAVNQLLIVGFYLVNVGMVALAIRLGGVAIDIQQSVELVSMKVGWVLIILSWMHFFNVMVLTGIRKRSAS